MDITPAFYSLDSLKSFFLNNKIEQIDKLEKSDVYKIKCDDCDHVYIGQTGRSFKTRIGEHFGLKRPSLVADHMHDHSHTNVNNVEILHVNQKGKKLDLLEAYEIKNQARKYPLMNKQIDLIDSPLLEIPAHIHS